MASDNPMTPAEQAREALEKARVLAIAIKGHVACYKELVRTSRVLNASIQMDADNIETACTAALSALAPAADEVRLKVRWDEQGNLWVGNFCPGFIWRPHAATWVADFIEETGRHLRLGQYNTRDAARAALLEKVGA